MRTLSLVTLVLAIVIACFSSLTVAERVNNNTTCPSYQDNDFDYYLVGCCCWLCTYLLLDKL